MSKHREGDEEIHDGYRWLAQSCPVCSLRPVTFVGRRGGNSHREGIGVECDIWSCDRCGLIFPDPMPIPVGGLQQHYDVDADKFFVNHDPTRKINTAHLILDDAEKILAGKGRLLDVGAGRGETLKIAQERGWVAEGIEPSESFAAYAEKESGAKIYAKPLEECGLTDSYYDVVILSAVLEHLYNPDDVIAEISRVLKPGGWLFFDVPNERGLVFRVGNIYQRLRGRDWCINLSPTFSPYHLFGFGLKSVRMILEANGLKLRKRLFFGGECLLPSRPGLIGKLEGQVAIVVTKLSNLGRMGSYIAAWAQKEIGE
jgi:2-polyprenyl-3-methyl-5-hydroxy-6-metoxy-1,4-benzoquinol methylase